LKIFIGTTEAEETIDGRPVGGGLLGSGEGDIMLTGVHKLTDETGTLSDGDAVDRSSPSGVKTSVSAPLKVGHVLGDAFVENSIRFVNVKLLERPNV